MAPTRRLTLISIKCVDLFNDLTWDRISLKVQEDGGTKRSILHAEPFYYEDGDWFPLGRTVDYKGGVVLTLEDFRGDEASDVIATHTFTDQLLDTYPELKLIGDDGDCEYRLQYRIDRLAQPAEPPPPPVPPGEIPPPAADVPQPEFMSPKYTPKGGVGTAENPVGLGDIDQAKTLPSGRKAKWILSVDGGGTRGIVALWNLKAIERYYNKKAIDIFDMFAGSSTGGIIAAALASGRFTTDDLIRTYDDPATRRALFTPNVADQTERLWEFPIPGDLEGRTVRKVCEELSSLKWGLGGLVVLIDSFTIALPLYVAFASSVSFGIALIPGIALGSTWLLILAALNYLVFSASPDFPGLLTQLVKSFAPEIFVPKYIDLTKFNALDAFFPTQTLADCPRDILITAKDMDRGETLYFTCFKDADGTKRGTFRDVKISSVLKATSAAPTFFNPVLSLVDGGVGSFNNPAFAAVMEAIYYSTKEDRATRNPLAPLTPGDLYREGETVVWSLGTGSVTGRFTAGKLIPGESLPLEDRTDMIRFWLDYIVNDAFLSANEQQSYFNREILDKLLGRIEYRRINIFLNAESLGGLRFENIDERLRSMKMDAVEGQYVSMREVATRFADHVWNEYFANYETSKSRLPTKEQELAAAGAAATDVLKEEVAALRKDLARFQMGIELGKPTRGESFVESSLVFVNELNAVQPRPSS